MNQPAPAMHTNYALTFVGPINYPATKSLRSACCSVINNGATHLHLLLSSYGGNTQEGFALYNFLRALPIELTTHNIGAIESIANVVFLAGSVRYACPTSRFFNHDLTWTYGTETLTRLVMAERQLSLDHDAAQFIDLMAIHTNLTRTQLKSMKFLKKPIIIVPTRAKEIGLINDIVDAGIPAGTVSYNVEY